MDDIECVVIGAGVVGLAVARDLAVRGRDVVVVEAELGIGTGISSRNSEVIHAGIYYPKGSLKAQLCLRGRELLYPFCADHAVAHRQCGKLVVATSDDQLADLARIRERAHANGAIEVDWIPVEQARELEPALTMVAALHSPVTGILDSHGFMLALQGDLEASGGMIAFGSPVTGGRYTGTDIILTIGGAEAAELRARWVINCGGLGAQNVAARLAGLPASAVPPQYFAKGNYFSLSGRPPFSRLIYPAPVPGGLGIHATLDLGGRVRFGPDVEWIEHPDFDVDQRRAESFYAAIRRYWPGLPDGSLTADYAGIRPKIVGPGQGEADFVIQGPDDNGVRGLINLFGIESPGLTASLAIAERVAGIVG